MIIKAQNGMHYDIYTVILNGRKVICRDNADRRRKPCLGEYETPSRASDVYRDIMNETSGYYEMPEI